MLRAEDLSQISASTNNAKLDDTTCYAYTNENGIASFSLKFISGIGQTCWLVFESSGTKSLPSFQINLQNLISNVVILQSSPQTLVYKICNIIKK